MRIASCEVLHDSAELVAQSRILGVEALKALLLPLDLVKDSAEDVHEISGWVHFDDQLDRASKLGVEPSCTKSINISLPAVQCWIRAKTRREKMMKK